ncbi:MAG: hypothetical protein ACE5EU_11015, partial [Paracoccaceae bacterium]
MARGIAAALACVAAATASEPAAPTRIARIAFLQATLTGFAAVRLTLACFAAVAEALVGSAAAVVTTVVTRGFAAVV